MHNTTTLLRCGHGAARAPPSPDALLSVQLLLRPWWLQPLLLQPLLLLLLLLQLQQQHRQLPALQLKCCRRQLRLASRGRLLRCPAHSGPMHRRRHHRRRRRLDSRRALRLAAALWLAWLAFAGLGAAATW
jgi:hypothetical protein